MKILNKMKVELGKVNDKINELIDLEATETLSEEQQAEFKELEGQKVEMQGKIDRRQQYLDDKKKQATVDEEDLGEEIESIHNRQEDDPTGGFNHFGELALAIRGACMPGSRDVDERLRVIAGPTGMNEAVSSEGGFLLPQQFNTAIWDGMRADEDNLLMETDNYTVEGGSLTFNANAETSRATGSRYGGVRGYWLAEADQITSSKPKFRQLELKPKKLAVLIYATDELMQGAGIALGQYLTRAAVSEIGFMTSDAIIEGDGSGKPLGIINSGCMVSVAKESGQAADTIVTENIIKMYSRLHPRALKNAKWRINVDILPQLFTMTLNVGTGGVPVYIAAGGISGKPYATIFGLPVKAIEFASTLGDKGDITLGDLSAYASGTKGGIQSAMSIHLRFDYNEQVFRFIFMVDGQPWLASAITPFKGSKTQSPFVTLAERA